MANAPPVDVGFARRRRERRLRCFLRHEEMTVRMAVAGAVHHSAYKPKTTEIEIGVQAGRPLFHDFDIDFDDTNPDVFDAPATI